MAKIHMSGFKDMDDLLNHLSESAENLNEKRNVSFDELFTQSFMQNCSSFSSIYDLLKAGGFKVTCQKDFDKIPDSKLDNYIAKCTTYDSWEDMLDDATELYMLSELGI